MNKLLILNRLRWPLRLPIKWAVFGLTLLAVCFPYPSRLVRHIQHWRNPNALIEPGAPALQPLVEEVRPRLAGGLSPKEALKRVERFVYEKIKYEWDWNTWGTADYLPTVTEVIERGQEDCDGRAVVAASLLRNFGFQAQIVTDLAHVWVKTDKGETMGPGKTKAIVATEKGLRVKPGALTELPRAVSYGLAVFPLFRELIVVGVLWLLLLRSGGSLRWQAAAGACFLLGLFLLRAGGEDYRQPTAWLEWLGFASFVAGFLIRLIPVTRVVRSPSRL